jgi:uncharacterized protein
MKGWGGAVGLILATAIIAGCSASASPHYYTLDSTAPLRAGAGSETAVLVDPVTVPATVDRPEFIVQTAPNRVEVEEYERWAAPLDDLIARAVAGDLTRLLGTQDVSTEPLPNFAPAYQVSINVERFESIDKQSASLDAVWAVRRSGTNQVRIGRTVATQPVQGDGFDALAAAHSRALAQLSSDIATAIQSESEDTPGIKTSRR